MKKIGVLMVDDHAIMRDGIRALLSHHDDIEVIGEASEGVEALQKAEELEPDVVVMDLAMPGISGIEATRRIKKKKPEVKVLILTQHDKKDYILAAIKAGSSGYVTKKALGSDLVSAIRTVYKGESFLYPSVAAVLIEDYQQRPGAKDPYDQLTPRESEILKLVAEGHTSREIADMLFISLKTVHAHRTKVRQKLNIHNKTDLIRLAMKKGLIDIDV